MTVKTPAQINFQQGKQQRRQGKLAAAIDCFRETIRLQADFVPAYNNLANALQTDGQIEPAITLYQQAILTLNLYLNGICAQDGELAYATLCGRFDNPLDQSPLTTENPYEQDENL